MAKVTVEFEVEGPQIMIVGGDMTHLEKVTVVPLDPDKVVDLPKFKVGEVFQPLVQNITIQDVKDVRDFLPDLERELKRQGMSLGR